MQNDLNSSPLIRAISFGVGISAIAMGAPACAKSYYEHPTIDSEDNSLDELLGEFVDIGTIETAIQTEREIIFVPYIPAAAATSSPSPIVSAAASISLDNDTPDTMPKQVTPDQDVAEQLAEMRAELQAQRNLIAEQTAMIERQQSAINIMLSERSSGIAMQEMQIMRGAGVAQSAPVIGSANQVQGQDAGQGSPNIAQNLPAKGQTVGEAPAEEQNVAAEVTAVPQGSGVLTPRGTTVVESSFEYSRSSNNRLVFRGIELIPGLQVGLIEASDADRDTVVGTASIRHGITRRLEVEARMPALARQDRIQVVQQRNQGIVRELKLNDYYIGDAELAIRYQLNEAKGPEQPIYVANLRIKSNTGRGPFDIGYDEFGVATGLTTGSGFWGVQGGMSFLMPSDPVVLYGGASYLYHIPANVDKLVGGAFVGRVDPGDALSVNLGFGFSVNPRFSFSLGYGHSIIFPTKTEIGGTNQRSSMAHVGSLSIGTSYRMSERQSFSIGLELGMTADAPDMSIALRLPLRF
jgi:hypothetical protein